MRRFSRVVLLLGIGGIAAAFLAGYAARYVAPDTLWWLQLVALGLPVLAVLVVLGGVGAALAKEWGVFFAFAPLIVLAAVRFFPAGAGGDAAAPALTVMTYNAGSSGAGHTSASFRALVEGVEPDVLALQEVPIKRLGEPGAVVLPGGFGGVLASGRFESTPPAQYVRSWSQPVFVRAEGGPRLRAATAVMLRAGDRVGGRSNARVELEWGGRAFALYNVHLRSFDRRRPWEMDREEVGVRGWLGAWRAALRAYREDFTARADEARRLREALDAEPLPVIVSGDFNSTAHQWVFAHVAEGLRDAISEAGVWRRATFPATRPLVGIDHVLVSEEWEVHGGWVPDDAHADHRPVVVRVGFKAPPG